jgi:putative ABC transport system substrate-binding protein
LIGSPSGGWPTISRRARTSKKDKELVTLEIDFTGFYAIHHRNNVPAVYRLSEFARDGGLLSYGIDLVDLWRRATTYVDRILRGEKPGDLPVQFPTKFVMVLNLKAAKARGLAIPPSILLRATEVVE